MNKNGIFTEKVAFVTGAASGIGRAAALAFARAGYHVVALARRADRLAALEAQFAALDGPHGALAPVAGDVREPTASARAVDEALSRFGRLDALIANAGVGHRGALADADANDVDVLLRTNLDGVVHSVRAAVPAMRRTGGGHIVLVSSVTATMPGPYVALYAASKAFISSLAESLRAELATDGITVTDARLGRTETEFSEKRLGTPGRTRTFGPSSMSAEQVAEALVRAMERRQPVLVMRPIDRLILLANRLAPGLIARLVTRQYR